MILQLIIGVDMELQKVGLFVSRMRSLLQRLRHLPGRLSQLCPRTLLRAHTSSTFQHGGESWCSMATLASGVSFWASIGTARSSGTSLETCMSNWPRSGASPGKHCASIGPPPTWPWHTPPLPRRCQDQHSAASLPWGDRRCPSRCALATLDPICLACPEEGSGTACTPFSHLHILCSWLGPSPCPPCFCWLPPRALVGSCREGLSTERAPHWISWMISALSWTTFDISSSDLLGW